MGFALNYQGLSLRQTTVTVHDSPQSIVCSGTAYPLLIVRQFYCFHMVFCAKKTHGHTFYPTPAKNLCHSRLGKATTVEADVYFVLLAEV